MEIRIVDTENRDTIRFGALEEGVLLGVADYRISRSGKDLYLVKLYVLEEYRRRGIAAELLKYSHEKFSGCGFGIIYTTVIDTVEKTDEIFSFLVKNRYLPVAVKGHVAGYYLQDLLESAPVVKADKLAPLVNRVYSYEELKPEQIRHFQVLVEKKGYTMDIAGLKNEVCGFYVTEGEVRAVWYGKRLNDSDILIEEPVFLDESVKSHGMAGLLSCALQYISERRNAAARVLFRLSDEEFYKGMTEVLGEPEYDFRLQQYACMLK